MLTGDIQPLTTPRYLLRNSLSNQSDRGLMQHIFLALAQLGIKALAGQHVTKAVGSILSTLYTADEIHNEVGKYLLIEGLHRTRRIREALQLVRLVTLASKRWNTLCDLPGVQIAESQPLVDSYLWAEEYPAPSTRLPDLKGQSRVQ